MCTAKSDTSTAKTRVVNRAGGARANVDDRDLARDFNDKHQYVKYVDTVVGHLLCDVRNAEVMWLASVFEVRVKPLSIALYWHSSENEFTLQVLPQDSYAEFFGSGYYFTSYLIFVTRLE